VTPTYGEPTVSPRGSTTPSSRNKRALAPSVGDTNGSSLSVFQWIMTTRLGRYVVYSVLGVTTASLVGIVMLFYYSVWLIISRGPWTGWIVPEKTQEEET
jgi:hypothetical protein